MRELLVLNPNTSVAITALIAERVKRAAIAGEQLRTSCVAWGAPSIENRMDAAIAAVAVLDALSTQAEPSGVLLAAFGDPGLRAARELVECPVVGIGESSLARARQMGEFAILTIQPASLPLVHELIQVNACERECLAIEAVPVSVLQASEPADVRDRLIAAAERLVRGRSLRSIVLGGAPLGVHAEVLSQRLGLPCIDPIEAGVTALRDAVSKWPREPGALGKGASPGKRFEGDFGFLSRLNAKLSHSR